MKKGFRYKLTMLLAGRYEYPVSLKVGVLLSTGTEVATLNEQHLRRSMGLNSDYLLTIYSSIIQLTAEYVQLHFVIASM